MNEMTSRERILCVLAGDIPDRVPYYESSIDYPWICRLLGIDLDSTEDFHSGEYQSNTIEDQLRVNEILHRDNMSICCLPPIPAHLLPGEDQILFFHDGKLKTWEDVEAFEMPDVTTEEYQKPLRDFIEKCHGHNYASIAMTRCGISATYLAMGFEHFFLTLIDDPDLVETLMIKYAEWATKLVPILADIGFDIVMTLDDLSGKAGPLLNPEMYRERFFKHVRHIGDAIKATNMKWCYHSDGQITPLIDDLVDMGVDILDPIESACLDIVEIKEKYKGKLILSGNVDMDILSRKTPKEVEAFSLNLLKNVAPGGGLLFGSGNSVAVYTKVENILKMTDTCYKYGHYPINI